MNKPFVGIDHQPSLSEIGFQAGLKALNSRNPTPGLRHKSNHICNRGISILSVYLAAAAGLTTWSEPRFGLRKGWRRRVWEAFSYWATCWSGTRIARPGGLRKEGSTPLKAHVGSGRHDSRERPQSPLNWGHFFVTTSGGTMEA